MRQFLSFVVLVICASPMQAQTERLYTRLYSTTDGLPSNVITGFLQDSAGVLWVGTDRGIVGSFQDRFAIENVFQYLFIPPGPLRLVPSQSDNGYLLIGTGLAHEVAYVSSSYSWDGYDVRSIFPEWEDDSTNGSGFTAAVETPGGQVVLGTTGRGLWVRDVPARSHLRNSWVYRGSPVTHIPFAEDVTSLAATADGVVWVGTTRGLFHLRQGICRRVEWPQLRTASVTFLSVDSSATLWMGTTTGAVTIRGGRPQKLSGTNGTHVTSLVRTPNGDTWIGTRSNGLWRIRNGERMMFGLPDGLPSEHITTLSSDRSGNLWVGTDRGLVKVLPWTYRRYDAGRQLPGGEWWSAIEMSDGSLWFGGTGSLARIDGAVVRSWNAPGILRDNALLQLGEGPGKTLWALTNDGLVSFVDGTFRSFPDDSSVTDRRHASFLVSDPRYGAVVVHPWVVRRLREGRWETILRNPGNRPFNDAAFDRDGFLWVTSWTSCQVIDPAGATTTFPFVTSCLRAYTLENGSVAILDQDLGLVLSTELWAARTSGSTTSWTQNRRGEGRGNYTDGFVTPDGRRYVVWASSVIYEQGAPSSAGGPFVQNFERSTRFILQRGDGTPLFLSYSGDGATFITFDFRHQTFLQQPLLQALMVPQLASEDVTMLGTGKGSHARRFFEDRNGTLWCVGRRSISAFPRLEERAPAQPPFLLSVTAGAQRLLPGYVTTRGAVSTVQRWWRSRERGVLSGFEDGSRLNLRAEDNDLQFEAKSSSHTQELGTMYQARLDDHDTSWSEPMPVGRFVYHDVPQGTYRFRVRTLSSMGALSPERTMVVSLIKPFWRMSWFAIVGSITVAYVGIRVSSRRLRRLREEHARLTRQAVHENELKMARAVQMGMLPERAPDVPGFEIAARSMPATEVGGDFYDFLADGGRVGIAVGDVSGHGITGAMIVGMARTSLRFASSRFGTPSRILTVANERLRLDISRNVFIAMFYGLLDPKRRTMRYICAGQPTPILIRQGRSSFLPKSKGDRFPLGILPRVSYREDRMVLRPGDTLVLYTDGFVEAMNGAKEEFGFERFQRALERHVERPVKEFIDAVIHDVATHVAGAPQEDDMTMVVIRVRKEGRS